VREEDDPDPEAYAAEQVSDALLLCEQYSPGSLWDFQKVYIQMWVEKVDLKSLFSPVCAEYQVPLSNAKGWCDINQRVATMRRFKAREEQGLRPVLLYCGDHDPGGLNISEKIRKNLKDLEKAVGWNADNLKIDPFGLDFDFIKKHKLSWIDNLETASGERLDDPRHPDHKKAYVQDYIKKYGVRKCEANALVVRPEAGRKLCRDAILRYLDQDSITKYETWLAEQRDLAVAALSAAWRATLNGDD
jgi:hypothetical protein